MFSIEWISSALLLDPQAAEFSCQAEYFQH